MLCQAFISYLKNERHYSLHTIKSYSNDVSQFFYLLNLEPNRVDCLTVEDIRCWIVSLKKKSLTTKTINRKISALKTFFTFSKREKYVNFNPLLKIKTLKESQRLPIVISESSLEKLFSYN